MKKMIAFMSIIIVLLFIVPLQHFMEKEQVESDSCTIHILFAHAQQSIPLEQYIVGVLNGEMPSSFHLEALKAQAIAARTYAIQQTNYGQKPIQTTTAHQVYKPSEKDAYMAIYEQAVLETENQIMTYDNEPITAMFHAASNGQTESAQNYSGKELAYLQSVSSPEHYHETKQFTLEQFNKQLNSAFELQHIERAITKRNSTKRVAYITIQHTTFTGREIRERLGLKSTDFTIAITDNSQIELTTRGYGHGVGMSQYGANERAQQGQNAAQILNHYYPSARITPLTCPQDV